MGALGDLPLPFFPAILFFWASACSSVKEDRYLQPHQDSVCLVSIKAFFNEMIRMWQVLFLCPTPPQSVLQVRWEGGRDEGALEIPADLGVPSERHA